MSIAEKSETLSGENFSEKKCSEVEEDQVSLAQRTLMTKLYALEQEIEVFKSDFPQEYSCFLDKIEELRETYNSSLEEIKRQMTFEISPELNGKMMGEISKLDKLIKRFIEREVKFNILSNRLQMLIVKLNILYNVSISHPNEKEKVISQVERALKSEMEIAKEFKECEYILADDQLKDRIVTLISYADYEIFKTALRNSILSPQQIVEKLILLVQFKDFDYITTFKAFIEDELSDLGELLYLISDEEYRRTFEKEIETLIKKIAYAIDLNDQILDEDFWNNVFELESSILEFLKSHNVVEKDKVKVKLINRMNIHVDESEALTLPKTNAYLALISVFAKTHDERIKILIKLFKNVSNEVTYKEIYFLLLLFDAIDVIQSTPNSLSRYMESYIAKYPYNSKTIMKKRVLVLKSSSKKQYVMAFCLDEDADMTIDILRRLNIDFEIKNSDIYINSFYFNGLGNIFTNNSQH